MPSRTVTSTSASPTADLCGVCITDPAGPFAVAETVRPSVTRNSISVTCEKPLSPPALLVRRHRLNRLSLYRTRGASHRRYGHQESHDFH